MRAAVTRIEVQGAIVVDESGVDIAALPVRKAEVVLDIGVAGIAQRRRFEVADGVIPVFGVERTLACREVRIHAPGLVVFGARRHSALDADRAQRRQREQRAASRPDGAPPHRLATCMRASRTSARSVPALRVSSASLEK